MPEKIKDPYLFEKKVIEEVPIYYENLPWSPCIHLIIGFKVGALTDPEHKDGMAHFLEHVIFNGSPLFPTKKDVRAFKKKCTIDSFNAHTGYWYTEYTAECLPEHFEETVNGLTDLIFNPSIDPKDTTLEKSIILQELWDMFRNEKLLNYRKEWLLNVKPNLESKRMASPGGWPETVSTILPEELKKWHKAHYHRGNMYILLDGAIQEEHIDMLQKFLSRLPNGLPSRDIEKNIPVQKPLVNEITYTSKKIGMEQDHATLNLEIPTQRDTKNEEVLNMSAIFLYTILFEILREEMGLCYGVDVNCHTHIDHVFNYISLNLPADKIDLAQTKIFDILKEIGERKYEEKFNEEKRIYIDQIKAHERTASSIIGSASAQLLHHDAIIPLSTKLENIKAVTFDEILSYIGKTFVEKELYIEKILP